MLFHFLNFSQCVVCMFGCKKIYKVTNLKVYSKGWYLVLKKISFQELQRTARLDYKVVFLYLWYHKNKSAYWNSNGWGLGRTLGWALHISKSKPGASVFISLYFWRKPTVFRKLWMSFRFILHAMSDKAAFVSGALLCVQPLPGKPRSLPLRQRLPLTENEFAYMRPQIV